MCMIFNGKQSLIGYDLVLLPFPYIMVNPIQLLVLNKTEIVLQPLNMTFKHLVLVG